MELSFFPLILISVHSLPALRVWQSKKDSPGFFLLEFLALSSRAQLALAHACERRFGPQTAWCAAVAQCYTGFAGVTRLSM